MRFSILGFAVFFAATLPTFGADEAITFRTQVSIDHRGVSTPSANGNVIVWLTPLADNAKLPPATPQHARLLQKNKQFEPRLLAVPLGSIVDFPNQDPFFHNVFSLYNGKRFDLGLYEAGGSKTVRFDRPGVSFIFCNIHPEMSAAVVVLTTPYYAVSNAVGDVAIRNVRPGRYRVEVWYERSTPETLNALTREISLTSDVSIPTLHIPETVEGTLSHKNKFGKPYDTTHPYEPH
jgi:plastocyanin